MQVWRLSGGRGSEDFSLWKALRLLWKRPHTALGSLAFVLPVPHEDSIQDEHSASLEGDIVPFTRHSACQHLELGLLYLQNGEKLMCDLCKVPRFWCHVKTELIATTWALPQRSRNWVAYICTLEVEYGNTKRIGYLVAESAADGNVRGGSSEGQDRPSVSKQKLQVSGSYCMKKAM